MLMLLWNESDSLPPTPFSISHLVAVSSIFLATWLVTGFSPYLIKGLNNILQDLIQLLIQVHIEGVMMVNLLLMKLVEVIGSTVDGLPHTGNEKALKSHDYEPHPKTCSVF